MVKKTSEEKGPQIAFRRVCDFPGPPHKRQKTMWKNSGAANV